MNTNDVLTKRQKMTFREYLILADVGAIEDGTSDFVRQLPKPSDLCGIDIPQSLDEITFGQLIQLQGITKEIDLFFEPCKILLDVSNEQIVSENAITVISFAVWVSCEMERINNLLASTQIKPTPEEYQAGIDKLNFGPFGLVDYFALRMGFTDHEEVMNIPWIRIYQCMKIDAEKMLYERRLRKVYENKK